MLHQGYASQSGRREIMCPQKREAVEIATSAEMAYKVAIKFRTGPEHAHNEWQHWKVQSYKHYTLNWKTDCSATAERKTN